MNRWLVPGFLLAVWLGSSGPIYPQQYDERPVGSAAELETFFQRNNSGFYKIREQNEKPSNADRQVMEQMAKYYAFRVTWVANVNDQKKLGGFIKDFDSLVSRMYAKESSTHRETQQFFAQKLAEAFREVFSRPIETNRISTGNAAQMLPALGKTRVDEVSQFLVELIRDPKKHDAVKLYAVRALGEFFPARAYQEVDPKDRFSLARKQRELERIDALIEYIERFRPRLAQHAQKIRTLKNQLDTGKATPELLKDLDRLEGEYEAFRFLRREAISSLAQAGQPAVAANKKTNKVEGPVAEVLTQLLVPSKSEELDPSFTERIEAALGLCQLKLGDINEFQPHTSIYLIGLTLAEVGDRYREDYRNISLKSSDRKPLIHWKIMADRFKTGLDTMVANHQLSPTKAEVKILQDRGKALLDTIAAYQPLEDNRVASFRDVVTKQLAPTTRSLYKNIKAPEVDVPVK